MDRGGAGGGLDQGNTGSSALSGTAFSALADVLDDGGFHTKLDEIEGEEPNDVLTKRLIMHDVSERKSSIPRPKRFQSNHQKWRGSW